MAANTCAQITPTSTFGGFAVYNKDSGSACPDADKFELNKIMFFGKTPKNDPMFTVMDYEMFKNAKTGMWVATGAAAVLGVTAIVLGMKLYKK